MYSITPAGVDAITAWLRETEPDYTIRAESLLRIFCLWALPTDEALAHLAHDRGGGIDRRQFDGWRKLIGATTSAVAVLDSLLNSATATTAN